MKIIANNKEYNYEATEAPKTLQDFLEMNNFECNKVLVALNDQVVKVIDFPQTLLNDNDKLDIMSFVGGG